MLTEVVLQSSTPMTLKVEDMDHEEILYLKRITGLSPADLTLFTGEFARDGGYYQGRRASKRNPVFTFKLNPNYAANIEVSDIRELLYGMFLEPQSGSDGLKVLLKDDRRPDRYFIGYTESINTEMWEQGQEAQISMVCVDPFLRSNALTSFVDAAGVLSTPVTYSGSAATGFQAQLKVAVATTQIVLALDSNTAILVLQGSYAVNDIIDINTAIGSRSIKKNGVDIMAQLTPTSTWLKMDKATTVIRAAGTAFGDGKVKLMSYSYRGAWWGI